ncbi:MAG: phosphatidate cytidylyltransferase, partial [Pseudomonadota bacterium]
WMVWLIAIVVATDIAGYFVGKSFGGPKFWPKVSPKKTWSGTAGGWVAAAVVGGVFARHGGFGLAFVAVSVMASMASQAGDIFESAVKRKLDVKDSSNLIPGHGGFLDRFDGMMGAAVFVLIAGLFYAPGDM